MLWAGERAPAMVGVVSGCKSRGSDLHGHIAVHCFFPNRPKTYSEQTPQLAENETTKFTTVTRPESNDSGQRGRNHESLFVRASKHQPSR
jgi:hypothetical protein